MRPIPIPESWEEDLGGRRVVIGDPDPAHEDVDPCEYLVTESELYPGRLCFYSLVEVSQEDRKAIAEGANLLLVLDGGEVPWSLVPIDEWAEEDPA